MAKIADALGTKMTGAPVRPKAAAPATVRKEAPTAPSAAPAPSPAPEAPPSILQIAKDVPLASEMGQVLAKTKTAREKQADIQSKITEALPGYISERKAEMDIELAPLEAQLEFKPDREFFQNTANLFMMVGMIGSFIGGSDSANASALSQAALTGMMDGLIKGDDQEFLRQKIVFEQNAKLLNKKIDAIKDAYNASMELAVEKGVYEGQSELSKKLRDLQAGVPAAANETKSLEDTGKLIADLSRTQAAANRTKEQMDAAFERTKYSAQQANARALFNANAAAARAKAERDFKLAHPELGGTRGGAMNQRFAENIREAMAQVAGDIENISMFPAGTVTGTLAGMAGQSPETIKRSLISVFARKVTDTEARMLQQLIAGVEGHLAFALGGGYASSMSKARMDQYKSQIPKAGDDGYAAATFLARMRQEMNILAQNFPSKPGVSKEMNSAVQDIDKRINKAVPFTVKNVLEAYYGGEAAPQTGGFERLLGNRDGQSAPSTESQTLTFKTTDEAQAYAEENLPPGEQIKAIIGGKTYTLGVK